MLVRTVVFASALTMLASSAAFAGPVDILIGDKDGFGFATPCADVGTCSDLSSPSIDNRSAGEAAAVNGAQFTDVYSALFPENGPNSVSTGDVIFAFSGTLTSATLSFAAGDFQSDTFGAFNATVNGISEPFSFADGRDITLIHSIVLSAAELDAANLAGQVDLNLDRNGSGDFVAFDWFEVIGTTSGTGSVPEPITLSLFGAGLAGAAAMRRRRKK